MFVHRGLSSESSESTVIFHQAQWQTFSIENAAAQRLSAPLAMMAQASDSYPRSAEGIPYVESDQGGEDNLPSLIIPIKSSPATSDAHFVEIFPEEMEGTSVSTLMKVMRDEKTDPSVWADAAVLYMHHKPRVRDALTLLEEACELPGASNADKVRLLASTGIAHLAANQDVSNKQRGALDKDDFLRQAADQKFTQAGKLDTFFPMTWIGRGMLNLRKKEFLQAKFFFQTTLKQCGPVLPALLGMAAVMFGEGDYKGAQAKYAEAIRRYPMKSGAPTRVGFGLCCYKQGQVDRAKAAFSRALDLDPECVEAMVGAAVLDMAALDETARDFSSRTEKAIKMMSMANLLDHSNAMVQNHLANHYFWKWTPLTGTVEMTQGSTVVKGSQSIPLDPGEPIRIGTKFETIVKEDSTIDEENGTSFRIQSAWKDPSAAGLKVWKKDYERVFALAKGAYNSTSIQEIQAESLFFLARVYHVQQDIDNAHKFYDRACKLAPDLSPARFGLAQTLVVKEEYAAAAKELTQLLMTTTNATDALALLGLLEVRSGKNMEEGLGHLRKAIELDPLNPDLVLLEALALQQHRSNYAKSLDRYKQVVNLLNRKGSIVSYEVYANIGVLCHETRRFEESLEMYKKALWALDEDGGRRRATLNNKGVDGGRIRHKDNEMMYEYLDCGVKVEADGENKTVLKVIGGVDMDTSLFETGDHVRIGDSHFATVLNVSENDGIVVLVIDVAYDPMETDETATKAASLSVKRENSLLSIRKATTIVFNIARLHEVAGRTLASIELLKAVAKRNPAYVNCYLRLACIAVDCGSLKECSEWLKIAAAAAPGNPEVLTLIGNLHLSLCDWKPAQAVFDGLMAKKIPSVEAYASLSMGTIYFENLHVVEHRYAKHLQYASDYYKRILGKDPLNAYAANGLGTVLAEKGEIFKAKEVFNRVREVSGDNIADALLNLGHIYLAQKKHPEALQMYKSYMKRTEDGTSPITSKNRLDDVVDVLLYIAFAYFDWARHTELFNDSNAAPADGRYKEAMEHLSLAITKHGKKEITLKYNLCMTKLQAANCVLQKLTRNIPRTVAEVEEALSGLQESLQVVEGLLKDKEEGNKKIPIKTSMLEDFLKHCRANITSAQSHLEDERKRAEEDMAERQIRRLATEAALREEELKEALKKEEESKLQEERDRRAEAKMHQMEALQNGWQREQRVKDAEKEAKKSKKGPSYPGGEGFLVNEDEEEGGGHGLFDDSDDDGDDAENAGTKENSAKEAESAGEKGPSQSDLFGDSDEDQDDDGPKVSSKSKVAPDESDDELNVDEEEKEATGATTSKALFGDSDNEESDEELVQEDSKRANKETHDDDGQARKKRRVLQDEDE